MGVLVDAFGRRVTLGTRTLVGRAPTCAARCSSAHVSGEHAILLWHDGRWHVRDLGSRNGTFVDGRRLVPGERCAIDVGVTIHLGSEGDESRLVIAHAGPPTLRAVCVATQEVVVGDDLVQIGDGTDGGWTIFDDGRSWIAEREGAHREIADHEELLHDGRRWIVEIPPRAAREAVDSTESGAPRSIPLEVFTFRFDVSDDEENVAVDLYRRTQHAQRTSALLLVDPPEPDIGLGICKPHYLLVTLARARLADRSAGLSRDEEGWIYADELVRMLASSKPKINLEIFRARRLLQDKGVAGAGRIIERRPASGQLRIGSADLCVVDARTRAARSG